MTDLAPTPSLTTFPAVKCLKYFRYGIKQQPTNQSIIRPVLNHHTIFQVLLSIFNSYLIQIIQAANILEPTFSHHFMRKLYLHKDVKRLCKSMKKFFPPPEKLPRTASCCRSSEKGCGFEKITHFEVRFWVDSSTYHRIV